MEEEESKFEVESHESGIWDGHAGDAREALGEEQPGADTKKLRFTMG